jgi:hypothetical protein
MVCTVELAAAKEDTLSSFLLPTANEFKNGTDTV